MSELIVIAFPDEGRAAEVLDMLKRLESDRSIELDDACTVTRGDDGAIQLHQSLTPGPTRGAGRSAWGTLIGSLFFLPLVALAVGAATGSVGGRLAEYGIDGPFVHSLSEQLELGSSALFLRVRRALPERVVLELHRHGGSIVRASLTADAERRFRSALARNAAAAI